MKFRYSDKLICPLDGTPLQLAETRLQCPQGHSFDIARQGYVNLLPVQHKRSKSPGDSKEMIEARRAFLDSGAYQPISDELTKLVSTYSVKESTILDAGCGEGYYLDNIVSSHSQITGIGLDIAKPAILAACKHRQNITWLVASNKSLPLADHSLDIIICGFGFPVFSEFRRCLKPGGVVILVDADEDHLIELRRIIYPQVKQSPAPPLEQAVEHGFELTEEKPLKYASGTLNREQLQQLMIMTPHLYRAPAEGKKAAAELEALDLTIHVRFRVLI